MFAYVSFYIVRPIFRDSFTFPRASRSVARAAIKSPTFRSLTVRREENRTNAKFVTRCETTRDNMCMFCVFLTTRLIISFSLFLSLVSQCWCEIIRLSSPTTGYEHAVEQPALSWFIQFPRQLTEKRVRRSRERDMSLRVYEFR